MSEVTDLRVKPDYDINNIKSYLQAEEVAAMEKLREALPTHFLDDEHCKMWVTDSTLCRFLRARNWNHAAALKMLTDTLEWRLEVSFFSQVLCLNGRPSVTQFSVYNIQLCAKFLDFSVFESSGSLLPDTGIVLLRQKIRPDT